MRTTLSLDDDVAVLIEKARRKGDRSLTDVVNEALRRGLRDMAGARPPRARYSTPSSDLGRCYAGRLDDIAEALTVAEGEDHR
jgi:hypothetical protein